MTLNGAYKHVQPFLSLCALIVVIFVFNGQSQTKSSSPRLTFEAATVKRNTPADPGGFFSFGGCRGIDSNPAATSSSAPPLGRCRFVGLSVTDLICKAYVRDTPLLCGQAVTGGPSWTEQDRYDLDGKAEDPAEATEAQLFLMLQTLLTDSLNLQFHYQAKEFDGYLLVVPKKPSKLKVPSDDGPPSIEFFGDGRIVVRHASMSYFASAITGMFHGPVTDATDLNGTYDFTLIREGNDIDSLIHAVEDQIGIRVQPGKVSTDIIVLDHVERPRLK
jgi:uncharacterized protein (TIGR03435 family)